MKKQSKNVLFEQVATFKLPFSRYSFSAKFCLNKKIFISLNTLLILFCYMISSLNATSIEDGIDYSTSQQEHEELHSIHSYNKNNNKNMKKQNYDPFMEVNNKYVYKINDMNFAQKEQIDSEEDSINDKSNMKIKRRQVKKNSNEQPQIVHNQLPYINSGNGMAPSYTTPFEYNPYTPMPHNT